MRRFAAIAALLATLGLVSGCGSDDKDGPETISVHTVQLDDGRSVMCIWERSQWDSAAGLSCDWAGAK